MFTGIIKGLGEVVLLQDNGDMRMTVKTSLPLDDAEMGASIACNGICLTVIEKTVDSFTVQMSHETLQVTTAKNWRVGQRLNLERALCVGDELGGHMVLGHVDGVARILSVEGEGESFRYRFEVPPAFASFIAPKGSVAIDGVSLTVNEVEGSVFGVNIIPHTRLHTCFGFYAPGDLVNFEVDLMARYLARMQKIG